MSAQELSLAELEDRAEETARLLGHLANKHRLMILCRLALQEETTVTSLCQAVGLSQSAVSQHLARLREEGIVQARREATFIHYRIADKRAVRVLRALKEIMCP